MLHIIQNDPEVPPGNLIEHLGAPYLVHHPYLDGLFPEMRNITSLIVLGGAMGANDDLRHPFLTGVKQLIRRVVGADIPYLGICLGGQLLAATLGAQVASQRWEEIGTAQVALTAAGSTDPLFAGISERFATFQWHHDSFDLPEGATLLASSTRCPSQAFRVGRCAWGLQFHPEVTGEIIRDWCAWESSTREATDAFVTEFSRHETGYRAVSRQLMKNFGSIGTAAEAP